jgi:hypothetical protein
MIEIVANPTHEEYEGMIAWLGPKFNPATLNRIAIVKALGTLEPIRVMSRGLSLETSISRNNRLCLSKVG